MADRKKKGKQQQQQQQTHDAYNGDVIAKLSHQCFPQQLKFFTLEKA